MHATASPRAVPSLPSHDVPLDYPFDLHWTAQDLADAMLPPLHDVDFTPPANDPRGHGPRRPRLFGYARIAPQPRFRVG